jgi:hypothetical protein
MSESAALVAQHQRDMRRAGIVAMISIAAAAIWAMWLGWTAWVGQIEEVAALQSSREAPDADQSKSEPKPINASRGTVSQSRTAIPKLDEAVFSARLWVPPLRPIQALASKPSEPPAPPPPPFKMRLVGLQYGAIAEDVSALVYDPDAFKVVRVARGDSIGRYTLEHLHVANGEVVFTDTQHPSKPRHTVMLSTLVAPRTLWKSVSRPVMDGGAP